MLLVLLFSVVYQAADVFKVLFFFCFYFALLLYDFSVLFYEFKSVSKTGTFFNFLIRCFFGASVQNVLSNGVVEQDGFLLDKTHASTKVGDLVVADVLAVESDLTVIHIVESEK